MTKVNNFNRVSFVCTAESYANKVVTLAVILILKSNTT